MMAPIPDKIAARALWYVAPDRIELRDEILPKPAENEVLVATSFSGVSRGTERLVMAGKVDRGEWERMRAPLQAGDFPFPVKYGYCATGIVEAGDKQLIGKPVFVLHPHQDRFVAPASMATPIPDGVSLRRATLAANMETALNGLWDSGAGPADRIVVVGGGIVGLLVGYLAARLPGAEVMLVDVAEERRAIAETLGMRFYSPTPATGGGKDLRTVGWVEPPCETQHSRVVPKVVGPPSSAQPTTPSQDLISLASGGEGIPANADVVFHTSATAPGLATAIAAAGFEATIVELSWYGEGTIPVPLGGAFHSRRLKLISSQVGQVATSRRARWDYRRRLTAALALLKDDRLDALLTEEIAFADAPVKLPGLLAAGARGLAPVVRYG
jgi:threonine dehydrogenase-like Zn-dependent dehydrogenase